MPFDDDFPPGVTVDDLRVEASCRTCARRRLGTLGCDAFPDEIPLPIITGKVKHTRPYPGDHGLTYLKGDPHPLGYQPS